jgi:hypothetical protein
MRISRSMLVAVLAGVLAAPASAQSIPALTVLSTSAAAARPDLVTLRAALDKEREDLHTEVTSVNSACGAVKEGSTDETRCNKRKENLLIALPAHIQRTRDFNAAAQAANNASSPVPSPAPVPAPSSANQKDAARLAAAFCAATAMTANDKDALRAAGLVSASAAERFELYEKASREQHTALIKKQNDLMFDLALGAAEAGLKKGAVAVKNANVDAALKYLQKQKDAKTLKPLTDALKQLQRQKDRVAAAEGLVFAAQTFKEDVNGLDAAMQDPEHQNMIAVATALKILLPVAAKVAGDETPVGQIITGAELTESAAYLYYLTGEVNSLENVPESQLTKLATLDQLLRRHLQEVRDAREAYQKATGATGDPNCSPDIAILAVAPPTATD